MARITGIGGIFFRADNPKALRDWYVEHLGVIPDSHFDGTDFKWREKDAPHIIGRTVWGPFDRDTSYFGDSAQAYMINYRVDDLDGVIAQLREAGCAVEDKIEEYDYGRFAWATDPEGIRMELWQPAGEEEA